ncbi:MAG: hypothetical protein EBZ47_03420 [Chlamydiae bacterium]|nr:hypothetical protein [Chlamydiota bacterium]
MSQPIVCKKKAKSICSALFLVMLGIVGLSQLGWPYILLTIGIPLALRQYLLRKNYDVFVTLFIFIGSFISIQYTSSWSMILSIMFILGGIYIFFRDFIESKTCPESETEEDVNEEIEEQQH